MKSSEYLTNNVMLDLVQAALADGSTDPDSSSVDMAYNGGFDAVCFVCICGTITGSGTVTMTAQQSGDDGSADDFTALTGASAAASGSGDSDKLLVVDVKRPSKRYVRVNLTRATANSVIGGVLAIRYRGKNLPAATLSAALAAAITQVKDAAESA